MHRVRREDVSVSGEGKRERVEEREKKKRRRKKMVRATKKILINAHHTLEPRVFFIQSSWANPASTPAKYLLHLAPVTTGETDVSLGYSG